MRNATMLIITQTQMTEEQENLLTLTLKSFVKVEGEVITCTQEPKDIIEAIDLLQEQDGDDMCAYAVSNEFDQVLALKPLTGEEFHQVVACAMMASKMGELLDEDA